MWTEPMTGKSVGYKEGVEFFEHAWAMLAELELKLKSDPLDVFDVTNIKKGVYAEYLRQLRDCAISLSLETLTQEGEAAAAGCLEYLLTEIDAKIEALQSVRTILVEQAKEQPGTTSNVVTSKKGVSAHA